MVELANDVIDQLDSDPRIMLKHNSNWADEIDTEGFVLMTMSEWKNIQQELRDADPNCFRGEYGIGTNEWIDVPTDPEDIILMYEVKLVPKDTYNFLKQEVAPYSRYGIIPHPLELIGEY